MQEIIGSSDDILFDLEQIKLISQREVRLSGSQKDKVDRLPQKKQEQAKKEILAKKEQEKKTFLRIWTLELEDKVKKSDLPPEIVSQILEMTSYAKDRNMTFIYDIERKIETLKEQVKENERKKMEEAMEKDMAVMGAVTSAVVGATVAGAVLGPYVQVRYDKEEFEKRSETYLEEKIIPKLAMAAEKPIVPVEPIRTYKTKRGSPYPKSHITLDKKHKDEWMALLVQKTQAEQKAKGQKVQTPEEIVANFGLLTVMEQKTTINGLKKENPEVAVKQEQETKVNDQVILAKGIERLRRKHKEKEAKIAASRSKKAARAKGQSGLQQRPKNNRQTAAVRQPFSGPMSAAVKREMGLSIKMHDPQTVEKMKQEIKAQDQAVIEKGVERLARKKKEKEARKARALEKMKEQVALKKARIQSKGPRIAEREKTEKPITVTKEVEQRNNRPQPVTVAKEEEKQLGKVKDFAKTPEGMAARAEAVREQITENKGPNRLFDKGFSQFLAMAQERVQNQGKELSEIDRRKQQELQKKINKGAPNLFLQAHRKYKEVS